MQTSFEAIIRQPGRPDRVVALVPGITLFGRSEECDVPLPDLGVSRRHLRLNVRPNDVLAEDLRSGNGTFMHGHRIEGTVLLNPGELLEIEPFTIELRRTQRHETPPTPESRREASARVDVIGGPSLAQGSYVITPAGLSIGRSEFRDLVILDPAASRHHCDIVFQSDHWRLVDNGSSNGVHLNDERVRDARLTHGDLLRVGNTELRFFDLGDTPGHSIPPTGAKREWTQELSLPLPDPAEVPPVEDEDSTGPSRSERISLAENSVNTQTLGQSGLNLLPVSVGFAAVAVLALAATILVGLAALLLLPPQPVGLLAEAPEPSPPTWHLELDASRPNATVSELFEQGVQHMRGREPGPALEAFYQVLLAEPGNRAAERLSYTAAEHLLLSKLEKDVNRAAAAREAYEAERDELLEAWPRRSAASALAERFRDDPVVIARTGWEASEDEIAVTAAIDEGIRLAQDGSWVKARAQLDDAMAKTRNPALRDRASIGKAAAAQRLTRQIAPHWTAGVIAEIQGDHDRARSHYQRVIERDPAHVSAQLRLERLDRSAP